MLPGTFLDFLRFWYIPNQKASSKGTVNKLDSPVLLPSPPLSSPLLWLIPLFLSSLIPLFPLSLPIPVSIEADIVLAKERKEFTLVGASDEVVHALVHGGLHEPLLLRYPHYLLHLLRGIVRYSKLSRE